MALEKLLKIWREKTKTGIPKVGKERREFIRLVYPPHTRPVFKVKERELEVLDISEKGMKILNSRQIKFGKNVYGTLYFSSGKTINLTGKIVWQHETELGLFMTQIPRFIILDEVRSLLRAMSNAN